jgi:hypothetical protein
MNKRIKELIDKATTIEEHGWGASYENFDKEKFAELIVKECARVAFATAIGDGTPDEIYDAIKETFRS